jgi:hypothetical protein
MSDEELLKPCRELFVLLTNQIRAMEMQVSKDIERYGHDDREYAEQRWGEFQMSVAALRRERETMLKAITDYQGLQIRPPSFVTSRSVHRL